jgi:DNA-binding LytR/AlgR family response regulator
LKYSEPTDVFYLEAAGSGVLRHTARVANAVRASLGQLAERRAPAHSLRMPHLFVINTGHIVEFNS